MTNFCRILIICSMFQISSLDGCCRRVKQVCANNWVSSRYQNLDRNPELPIVDGRHQQAQRLIRQEWLHLSDPAHYFCAGLFTGVIFTLVVNKLLTEIKDC
jgi:hypothetical protein